MATRTPFTDTGVLCPQNIQVERVSLASDGTEENGFSEDATISANGRYVTYASVATNLVPDDTNGSEDVFLYDRKTGTTERISVASDGTEGNYLSFGSSISAHGRFVAYASVASNLTPGDTNDSGDIFLFDRKTGTTERISVASDGTEANGIDGQSSSHAAISANGRFVTYTSVATNLVSNDTNGTEDVFVVSTDYWLV
jgi:Tol biopolymer transport system component